VSFKNKTSWNKEALQGRARLYQIIRAFFLEKGVLEVETPIFSQAGNPDPTIQSLLADFRAFGSEKSLLRYAQTSPEFAMKRLIADGIGPIYQICKVFRLGEVGRLHNPEFSMLEWYRPDFTYMQLMDEIEELLQVLGISDTCKRISFSELFDRYLALDIMVASSEQLKLCAVQNGLEVVGLDDDYNDWCNLLLSHIIEPKLKDLGAVFVYDYPQSQAALANIRLEPYSVAERFELYIDGIEIANGYQELTDAAEYRRRFQAENNQREKMGFNEIALDENLLNALSDGLPNCAGVAFGLDRLLISFLGFKSLHDVLSFDFKQA